MLNSNKVKHSIYTILIERMLMKPLSMSNQIIKTK